MDKSELLGRVNNGIEHGGQIRIAKALHISGPSVANWFNGKSRPTETNMQQISKIFNIQYQEVLSAFNGDKDTLEKANSDAQMSNSIRLPLLRDGIRDVTDYVDKDIAMYITLPRFAFSVADYLFKCPDDSLAPMFRKGQYLAIEVRKNWKNVRHVNNALVKTENGFAIYTIKRIKEDEFELSNERISPIISKKPKIIGIVVGMFESFL